MRWNTISFITYSGVVGMRIIVGIQPEIDYLISGHGLEKGQSIVQMVEFLGRLYNLFGVFKSLLTVVLQY